MAPVPMAISSATQAVVLVWAPEAVSRAATMKVEAGMTAERYVLKYPKMVSVPGRVRDSGRAV